MTGKRLAVLIDGDNIPAALADVLFAEVAKLGTVAIRRVYARNSGINDWREKATAHCISLRETMPGKNSADMELAIDAMDLLHRGKLDGYCIASSDRDFAPLARRLREDGMLVTRYVRQTALDGGILDGSVELNAPSQPGSPGALKKAAEKKAVGKKAAPLLPLAAAQKLLLEAAQRIRPDGWISLAELAAGARTLDKTFKPNQYGSANIKKLLKKMPRFQFSPNEQEVKVLKGPTGIVKPSERAEVATTVASVEPTFVVEAS